MALARTLEARGSPGSSLEKSYSQLDLASDPHELDSVGQELGRVTGE
jgi:hypothetical protein